MDCPRCHDALHETRGTWACVQGHGRFVPPETMADRTRGPRLLAKADATLPTVACPGCGATMMLHHPRGFDVDACSCGGVWLDAGEERFLRERFGEAWWMAGEALLWIAGGLGGLG